MEQGIETLLYIISFISIVLWPDNRDVEFVFLN